MEMNYRAEYLNIGCQLFYQKHAENLRAIKYDTMFKRFFDDSGELVRNSYEVQDEIPLFDFYYYLIGNMGIDEIKERFGETATLETALQELGENCKKFYPKFKL